MDGTPILRCHATPHVAVPVGEGEIVCGLTYFTYALQLGKGGVVMVR